MDEDAVADLKQFIATKTAQQTTELRAAIAHDVAAHVAEAIDDSNEESATRLSDHEQRITRLEHKTV